MESTPTETAYWINRHEFPGRIKKIRIALYEAWRQSTYIDSEEIPFTTSISVSEIDSLEDEELQEALREQIRDLQSNRTSLTVPVATVHTRRFSHAWRIPLERRRPDENH